MLTRETLVQVLKDARPPVPPRPEVRRELAGKIPARSAQAIVLTGVRRCGKSVLQAQVMRRRQAPVYCNMEDARLYGMTPADFPALLAAMEETAAPGAPVYLDEVQEVPEWQRLVRTLLDRGRTVCVTGSNASLLGREVGSRLTGRHLSFEVFPFSYREYLDYTRQRPGPASLAAWLDDGGFPAYLRERDPHILEELLRDVVERDIAVRRGLREVRHPMNLALFLFANSGQPFSIQSLAKSLAIPSVGQAARIVEYLVDSYLLFALPKFSTSFKKRVVAPAKYYAIDNGLKRVVSPQRNPDVGRRLENAVYLELRRRRGALAWAGEKDSWECDFVTDREAIQVCAELAPHNRKREVRGLLEGCRLPGKRKALLLTSNQRDAFVADGVKVEVKPTWEWLQEQA